MSNQDLEGKVAIVTGAGGGIGAVVAYQFAQQGAKVVLAGPANTGLEATTNSITAAGFTAAHCEVDISSEDSVKALVAFTLQQYGRLDILDNNAAMQGLAEDTDIMSMPVETWDKVHAVNSRGTMLMCKHVIAPMIEVGGGSIINMSSGTATAGDMVSSAYAASKGAVNTLTRYVATQYGAQGIRCNAIAAGLVETPALKAGLPEPIVEIFKGHKLTGRIGKPTDIAAMISFLASDNASWITGQVYPVDGGFFAHQPTLHEVGVLMGQMSEQS